jgi:phage gpG-like protein
MDYKRAIKQLNEIKKDLKGHVRVVAPYRAAEVAVKMFKENFQREAFFGSRWKEVQRRKEFVIRKGKKVKNYATGAARIRRILTGATGDLGRSIEKSVPGNGTAKVYSDLPYSAVHNEGLRSGRGAGFMMPKRQFMGEHKRLSNAIVKVIEKTLDEVLKKHT